MPKFAIFKVTLMSNHLYYGDNLHILREYIKVPLR